MPTWPWSLPPAPSPSPASPAPAPSPSYSPVAITTPSHDDSTTFPPQTHYSQPPIQPPSPLTTPVVLPLLQVPSPSFIPPPPHYRRQGPSRQPPPLPLPLAPPPRASVVTGSAENDKQILVGLIIGGAIVGVFIMLFIFCFRKKEKRLDHHASPPDLPPVVPKGKFHNPAPRISRQLDQPGEDNIQLRPWNAFFVPPLDLNYSVDNSRLRNIGVAEGGNFTMLELAVATGNFSAENLLGEGGFGYVYKGVLPTQRKIAVKRLKMGSRQGEREFQAELETISRVHHRHLVSMIGFCIAGTERLLVYEFVENSTLEFHLHGKDKPAMKWETRMRIAIGAAKGLAYLHEDCNPTIIHRDIKSSNILLDYKYEAKVGDFGLAKFFTDTNHDITHVTTRVVGTFGYLAPEYIASGRASDKSDVFSYGVMLLELITGRKPLNKDLSSTDFLVPWAKPLLRQAMENNKFNTLVDPRLQKNCNHEELAIMASCAAACVRNSEQLRPRMSQILRTLEGDISPSELFNEGMKPGYSLVHDVFDTLCFGSVQTGDTRDSQSRLLNRPETYRRQR
ncbi:proline-rich receptor-like protein kinase PERK15 [Apium graveolens]|uniref:proline-rich receptor-like protein kinase PERK15 n=1 Tax=Apium graveolens TaxID=4045 RepID=UPI003D7AF2CD